MSHKIVIDTKTLPSLSLLRRELLGFAAPAFELATVRKQETAGQARVHLVKGLNKHPSLKGQVNG